ncbi:MAG: Rne/Rng family ribonuclease [Pseudomonadota bacterium]
MARKMLIDATHAEETRVVVVDGNKVEEFDFESENKRQLAGNIYLAKVSRVEPSLQAAFVEYGGNRHGFLAFSEIHPDYYQIPVADREALLAEERALAKAEAEAEEEPKPKRRSRRKPKAEKAEAVVSDDAVTSDDIPGMSVVDLDPGDAGDSAAEIVADDAADADATGEQPDAAPETAEATPAPEAAETQAEDQAEGETSAEAAAPEKTGADGSGDGSGDDEEQPFVAADSAAERDAEIESVADEDVSEEIRRPRKTRARKYKIQEVIKVRQILLVQVVKEERGNKGAALTTYLSLAGRYCVLMPNTARGGGISRKITNATDRKKLKDIASAIEVPEGAGLIVRTAGAKRTKSEIKRDYEYLQRLWEQIRELTLKSIAPAKIYEEGNLIKRAIRDLYNRDIEEVMVEGEGGYRVAKDFMKMIMPSHAKNVKQYDEPMPLFARFQVESYLASMFNPVVQLRSGGYIVIGVTEALVAIDVNSGRATKKGSIEETALETNLEAADEIARQLRLRDLAGLIVIDFIDMEERRNNTSVEKRFKDRLKTDRARIQVGRISGFGLMEMSRQRLRPGMIEATTQPCPVCHGTGLIRSEDNLSLSILRQLEEEGVRRKSREVLLKAPVSIVNYLMNNKREHVARIEARYGMSVRIEADQFLIPPDFSIEKFKTATRVVSEAPVVSADASLMAEADAEVEENEPVAVETDDDDKPKKRRRRRRRRRGGSDSEGADSSTESAASDSNAGSDAGKAAPQSEKAPETGDGNADEKAGEKASDKASDTAGETAEEKPDDQGDEKPKKRRRRSRSKKSDNDKPADDKPADGGDAPSGNADSPAEPVEDASAAPADAVDAAPADAVDAAPADAVDAAPADDAVDAAPADDAVDAAHAAGAPVKEEVAAAEPAPEPEPQPEPVPEPAASVEPTPEPEPEMAEASASEPAKPKRRGWWSRGS